MLENAFVFNFDSSTKILILIIILLINYYMPTNGLYKIQDERFYTLIYL